MFEMTFYFYLFGKLKNKSNRKQKGLQKLKTDKKKKETFFFVNHEFTIFSKETIDVN